MKRNLLVIITLPGAVGVEINEPCATLGVNGNYGIDIDNLPSDHVKGCNYSDGVYNFIMS